MDGGIPSIKVQTPIRQIEAEITQLAGHINAATHRFLTLLAEFDNRKGWSDWGTQSCAHWLNWKCGIALGAAREKVRVAHALEKLPKISAAMATGELSYSKVRELTRVACPATEDTLLMIARHGSATHVETVVRHFRRAKEAEELSREAEQQANRSVSYHFDDNGSLLLRARIPAEAGAVVLKALNVAMDEVHKQALATVGIETEEKIPAGTSTVKLTPRMKRADALTMIAESFLAHGVEEMNGGDKLQIVVHVSAESLSSVHAEPVEAHSDCLEPVERCEFEDGPTIATETARRLACDCSVVRIVEDEDGNPLNVGRKTRSIPPALQRALNSRDKGCRFPGCCNTRFTHRHHIKHWANGGETSLKNLVTLCTFHHRLVHEGGVRVEVLDDGAFRFTKSSGESYEVDSRVARNSFHSPLTTHHSRSPSQWNGDRIDYGLAIQVLCQQEKRAERVPAGAE